ncbi:hypothetical protein L6164_003399 [Bauhinia variegata]|uniref:Uncharacterized protein n=1 Tax=Bauhinia variegata TaxID=167791 RepID=A0ACB9Q184_BAUVA|nr:hypothetical protein L6164_003399 [Bauhinia variegata]
MRIYISTNTYTGAPASYLLNILSQDIFMGVIKGHMKQEAKRKKKKKKRFSTIENMLIPEKKGVSQQQNKLILSSPGGPNLISTSHCPILTVASMQWKLDEQA